MDTAIVKGLETIAPEILAIIAVVWIFARYMERRDKMYADIQQEFMKAQDALLKAQEKRDVVYTETMTEMAKNIKSLELMIISHDAKQDGQAALHDMAMKDAVEDMRRKTSVRKKTRKRNRN